VPPPFELVAQPSIGLFANTTAAPAITQDNVAKAERDHYFDLGGTQIILPGLKAGVDAYYKIASNLLDEGQFGAPIILTPFNYQKGLLKGIEFLLTYDVENWSFYGNFAASQSLGKNITSAQFNFMPDELAFIANHYIHTDHDQTYTYSAGIKYRMPTTRTLFSANLIAGSGLRATNPGGTRMGPACRATSRSISAWFSRSIPASIREWSCASTSSTCSIRSIRSATAPGWVSATRNSVPAAPSSPG